MKKKLTIEEQIADMEQKGISFELCSRENAKCFLSYSNYYFKLKSYARNYDRYTASAKKGQYIQLDFAYLQELSMIDTCLRKLIFDIASDIEHALKVQLLLDLSKNENEDGYSIVSRYFAQDYLREKSVYDKIDKSAIGSLVKHHKEQDKDFALWELVEILSFGDFSDLYALYYGTYHSKNDYSSFLWSVKFLRNAAAHSNCLLNSLKTPYDISIHQTREIQEQVAKISTISEKTRKKWLKNPAIHDFVVMVYLFLNVVQDERTKKDGIERLTALYQERMLRHKDYFEKNATITECYLFTWRIIQYFCNKYRK